MSDEVTGPEDEDLAERLGEGMSERADERGTSRRTLVLAMAGLLAGLVATLVLLAVLLPEPRDIPDVRPGLRADVDRTQGDLTAVHHLNLEDLVRDPDSPAPPVLSVACALEQGEAPRRQRCELRATTYVDQTAFLRPQDVPTAACQSRTIALEDFPPQISTTGDACTVPIPFVWWQDEAATPVDGVAGWYVRGGALKPGKGQIAVTTRHTLGTYDIGDCPGEGCGVGQIQLPQVDYRSDGGR